MLNCGGLARFGNNLLGSRNRLLLLALGQMRSAFARFIDHFLSVRVRFRQNLLVTLLRFGELFLDFFSVKLALFDLPPTFLKNGKNRLVCESLQKECNKDRKSTRLNSSHITISYAVFCL